MLPRPMKADGCGPDAGTPSDVICLTDVDRAAELAAQSLAEEGAIAISPEAQLHARTFAVLASSWLAGGGEDVRPVLDAFLPRLVPLIQPGLPKETVFGLFQVLRHVLGFLAVARSTSSGRDAAAAGEGIQMVIQLLLRLALLHGCRTTVPPDVVPAGGWDQDARGKCGGSVPGEVDRMLELAATCDPELRSIWYSLASNEPSPAGKPVWTAGRPGCRRCQVHRHPGVAAMAELLATKVAEISSIREELMVKTRLEASTVDYLTFVIAVRQVQQQSEAPARNAALQTLRLACSHCPPLLGTALAGETSSPALVRLKDRLGPQPGPQSLANYLLNDSTLEECWALQRAFSGDEANGHHAEFAADPKGSRKPQRADDRKRYRSKKRHRGGEA